MTERRMVVAGLGYAGAAIAAEARAAGFSVLGTARDPAAARPPEGVVVLAFATAGDAIRAATHLVVTAAPGEDGDPVLAAHAASIAAAPALGWIGYLSTTGVYGDRGGAAVEEATPPAPGQARSQRRLEAEEAWRAAAAARGAALDLFRVGGIYGPGRSAFDELRAGVARRVVKPGHAFSRIHRDDIALAVVAAARRGTDPAAARRGTEPAAARRGTEPGAARRGTEPIAARRGTDPGALRPDRQRVLHLVDDEPAPSAEVVEEAARLLGVAPPPAIPFEEARARMSPMALSFWAENRRVTNAATKSALGIAWRCPTYREGLRRILAEEGQIPSSS